MYICIASNKQQFKRATKKTTNAKSHEKTSPVAGEDPAGRLPNLCTIYEILYTIYYMLYTWSRAPKVRSPPSLNTTCPDSCCGQPPY